MWQLSLPPMPTMRYFCTAVSTGIPECLIVAGGAGTGHIYLDTVEVMIGEQWSTVEPLPGKFAILHHAIHNRVFYLGYGDRLFCCDLDMLFSICSKPKKDKSRSKSLWRNHKRPVDEKGHESLCSSLISLRHHLLFTSNDDIFTLVPSTQSWVLVTTLPLIATACSALPTGELVIFDSYNNVHKGSLQMTSFDPSNKINMSSLTRLEHAGIKVLSKLKELLSHSLIFDVQGKIDMDWQSLLDMLKKHHLKEMSQQILYLLDGERQSYLAAYEQILDSRGSLDMLFVKVVLAGPPRLGKTTLHRRLTGKIIDISSAGETEQPSTGAVESGQVIMRNLSSTTTVMTPGKWSGTECISDEARMLLQFIHDANPMTVSEIVPKFSNPIKSTEDVAISRPSDEVSLVADDDKLEQQDEDTTPPGTASPLITVEVPTAVQHDMYDLYYATDINDMLMKAMASSDWKQVKYTLEYTALLNIQDTGGQPEFMDMLPALVMGPSLYLIFCKLIDNLKSPYNVSYRSPSGECSLPMESSYTVEEVILQTLSAVACFHSSDKVAEFSSSISKYLKTASNSLAFIVGTHKDMVTEEQIGSFDRELQRIITSTSFYEDGLVEFASEKRLVLAVDNKTGGEEEVKSFREFLEQRIKHHFKKTPLPVAWLVLSLVLRRRIKRLISLERCLQIAQRLGMSAEETKVALWFLHHHAGVLMYFPDIPELKDTIICDIQIIFDSVANMIIYTFKFGNMKKSAQDKFRETGQFILEDIKKALSKQEARDSRLDFIPYEDFFKALEQYFPIWKKGKTASQRNEDIKYFEVEDLQKALSEIKDFMPLEQLVKLMEHFNIIAFISQSSTYFMPCLLQNATEEELNQFPQSSSSQLHNPAPLMIRFACGFSPIGIFPALIANLVGHDKLKIIFKGIRKNVVQFHYGVHYDKVTLISQPRYYRIYIQRKFPSAPTPIHDVCVLIRNIIESALHMVTSHMNYTFSMHHQLAFECPLHPGKDHLCVVESEEAIPCVMCCQEDMMCPEPVEMQIQHLVWFGKDSTQVPYLPSQAQISPQYYGTNKPPYETNWTVSPLPCSISPVSNFNQAAWNTMSNEAAHTIHSRFSVSSPGASSVQSLTPQSPYYITSTGDISLSMADYSQVTHILEDLNNENLLALGSALGLNFPKLQRMSNLLGDMVVAWLRGDDNVIAVNGRPCWASLAKALEDCGHKGIASRIRMEFIK